MFKNLCRKKVKKTSLNEESCEYSSSSESSNNELVYQNKFVFLKKFDKGSDNSIKVSRKKVQYLRQRRNKTVFFKFFFGIFLQHLAYFFVSYNKLWSLTPLYVSGVVGFIVAVGICFSDTLFSGVLLSLPYLCTREGRSLILIYMALVLTGGPLRTIVGNYHETTRVLSCTEELSLNASNGMRQVLNDGQRAVMESMEGSIQKMHKLAENLKQNIEKIINAYNKVNEAVGGSHEFLDNIDKKCKELFWDWLCYVPNWVLKQVYNGIIKRVGPVFNKIKKDFTFGIKFDHQLSINVNIESQHEDLAKHIIEGIKEDFGFAINLYRWAHALLVFSFMWVFYAGFHYRRKYLTSLDFDNVYITQYFLKIDCRKLHRHQNYLLPLTKRETGKYVETKSKKLSSHEIGLTGIGLVLVTVHMIYSIIVFLVDYFFYQILFGFSKIASTGSSEGTVFEDWKELIIQDAVTLLRIATHGAVDSAETVEEFALQVFKILLLLKILDCTNYYYVILFEFKLIFNRYSPT